MGVAIDKISYLIYNIKNMTELPQGAGLDLALVHEVHRGADKEVLDDIGYGHAETAEAAARHAEKLRELLAGRALKAASEAVSFCGDHGLPLANCPCPGGAFSVHQRGRRYARRARREP